MKESLETTDVVVAGAGIIGLSLAIELASNGLGVTVLERARAMGESSWAAAGMLAANDPENPPQLRDLARHSLSLYPGFLARVEELSGKRVPLRTSATLQACHSGESFDPGYGPVLSPSELESLVPGISPGDRDMVRLAEQSLDPRDLCAALPLAAKAAGVRILEHSPVLSIDPHSAGVLVETQSGNVSAAHFVNAAGAWAESPALGRLPVGHPQVAPRKGQMATVRLRSGATLTHVLRTPGFYLVPRGDNRIVIGATVEDAGFDKTVEPHAIARLLRSAAELFPPIAEAEILESWAGLRPGSADNLPLIGQTAESTWAAAGHFRNGILLAPGTARLLSQAVRGERPEMDISRFDPRRSRPLDRAVPLPSDKPPIPAL